MNNDQVVLLWKTQWLNESWTLSRALSRHTVPVSLWEDQVSRRVFDVCQAAITGVPGYAPWDVAEVTLGYSQRSVRRLAQAGKLGRVWQGCFGLRSLLRFPRACLRTTLLLAPDDVDWWQYVPLLMERAFVPTWMAWHAWGRLSLPDLSAWRRRFQGAQPAPGREILGQTLQSREDGALASAEITRVWQAVPVAVQVQQNTSGRFATTLFDGADLARLEWNRWVLQLPDDATLTGFLPFSEGSIALQNGAELTVK